MVPDALIARIMSDVAEERLQKSLKDVSKRLQEEYSRGYTSLVVLELGTVYNDYVLPKKKFFFSMQPVPQKENLRGTAREVFMELEKMGLNPTVERWDTEYDGGYRIEANMWVATVS